MEQLSYRRNKWTDFYKIQYWQVYSDLHLPSFISVLYEHNTNHKEFAEYETEKENTSHQDLHTLIETRRTCAYVTGLYAHIESEIIFPCIQLNTVHIVRCTMRCSPANVLSDGLKETN